MPIPRVKLIARPVSQAAGITFRDMVEAELATRPVVRRHIDWVFDPETRVLILDLELATKAARDGFRQWFQDNLALIRTLVNGKAMAFLCSHDDAEIVPCSDPMRSEYREVRL